MNVYNLLSYTSDRKHQLDISCVMTSTPCVRVGALTDDTPMVPGVLSNKCMTMEPTRATG